MQPLRYAWNTNGCANHRLYDAIELVADAGYDGLALTLDWHHFDPFAEDWQQQAEKLKQTLDSKQLGSVIETGARFLLNHRTKHEPTLINPEASDEVLEQIGEILAPLAGSDDPRPAIAAHVERRHAVGRAEHLVAFLLEPETQHLGENHVVVGNEDTRHSKLHSLGQGNTPAMVNKASIRTGGERRYLAELGL